MTSKVNAYYAFVGLPASGKSTFRDHLTKNFRIAQRPYVICSSDDIIDDIAKERGETYDQVFDVAAPIAKKRMEGQRDIALMTNIDIFHDQPNLSVKKRKEWLSMIPDTWEKIALVFEVLPERKAVWNNRLAARPGKTISQHVLFNMEKSYVVPTEAEGFDAVIFIQNFG